MNLAPEQRHCKGVNLVRSTGLQVAHAGSRFPRSEEPRHQVTFGSSLLHAFSRLAAPVEMARLGIMGMGITDTVIVGQIAPADLPALAFGWAPTGVLLVGGIGLLLGGPGADGARGG
jgi:hypothetical protein